MKTKNIVCGILALTAVLALPVQAQSFLTKGLVAFYPFNGNANDQSGYQNNPLVNSASLARDRFDRANDAVNFSGSQQIQYASPSQIQTLTNLTVSCWIQTSNYFSGFHGVVCKATPVNPWVGFQVGVYHSRVQIQIDSTSYTGSVAINDGKWHAVCVVFDHDNSWAEIFVDGQLDSRFYTSVTSPTAPYQLNVGVDRFGSNYFTGSLDEIRMFNRALSVGEVAQLFAVEATEFSLPYLNLTIALSLSKQSPSSVIGTVSTTAAPQVLSLATKDLLNELAFDESVQGSWPSNSFPAQSTLALAGHSFVVLNGTNLLLNVSDLMTFNTAQPNVFSGKQDTTTGLGLATVKNLQIAGLTFDDTFVAGGNDLKFYVNGVLNLTVTDTTPTNGTYTETKQLKISNAAGDGSTQNINFISTGSVSAKGKSLLNL